MFHKLRVSRNWVNHWLTYFHPHFAFLPGYFRRNWKYSDGLQSLPRHCAWTWHQIPWNVRGDFMNLFVHFGIKHRFFLPAVYSSLERVSAFHVFFFLFTGVFCIISDLPFVCPAQPRTSQCPRSLWQSSALLWDEACSHSTWQENDESWREGKSAGLQWWERTRVADNWWQNAYNNSI